MNKIFIVTVIMCLITSCRPSITQSLNADNFAVMLANVDNPQLIDVRTIKEYAEGHIPCATLMDVRDPAFNSQIMSLDRNRPVFVYCRSGKRSLQAAEALEKIQFQTVYNLEGGIIAWKEAGKKVAIDSEMATD